MSIGLRLLRRVIAIRCHGLPWLIAVVLWTTLPTTGLADRAPPADWDRLYQSTYCKLGGLTRSSDGVIQIDYGPLGMQLNPIPISQYAITCHGAWTQKGDEAARKIYLDQIRYLLTEHVEVNETAVAYPYRFAWAAYGLKPIWHSAQAQGQAISALLRYYSDTRDEDALALVVKLKNALLLPIAQGGLASKTPEGFTWFEDYPSNPPAHVLDGFIYSLKGLYEYLLWFPEDEAAHAAFQDAVKGLKAALPAYETKGDIYIDRYKGGLTVTTDEYKRTLIDLMGTMHRIVPDPFFRYAQLRWSSFYRDTGLGEGDTIGFDGKRFRAQAQPRPVLPRNDLLSPESYIGGAETPKGAGFAETLDNREDTYLAPRKMGPTTILFRLTRPETINTLAFQLYNVKLFPRDVRLWVKSTGSHEFKRIKPVRSVNRRLFTFHFEPVETVEIKLRAACFEGQNRLVISKLGVGRTPAKPVQPKFGIFTTGPVKMAAAARVFALAIAPKAEDRFVIYRTADSKAALRTAKWAFDPIRAGEKVPVQAPYYQFRVLTSGRAAQAGWEDLRVLGYRDAEPGGDGSLVYASPRKVAEPALPARCGRDQAVR